jgi:hypothetical protein
MLAMWRRLLFAWLVGTSGAEGTVALLVDRDTPNVRVEGIGLATQVDGQSRESTV